MITPSVQISQNDLIQIVATITNKYYYPKEISFATTFFKISQHGEDKISWLDDGGIVVRFASGILFFFFFFFLDYSS